MKKPADVTTNRKKLLRSAAGLLTVGVAVVFGLIASTSSWAQSQTQDKSANSDALQYDVASIKRFTPGGPPNLNGFHPIVETPDGLVVRTATVKMLILRAYGVDAYQISGGPDWLNSERYDIDAKFDGATADELQKLSSDDRVLARQRMLQTILAERFNLTIHRENKELQIYSLIVAKNGPKLKEVKLEDVEANKTKAGPPPGRMDMTVGGSGGQMRAFASPLANLTQGLTNYLHRPVIDRTGLTGMYDFTLRWTPDENQAQGTSAAQAPGGSASGLPSSDPTGGASLFTAIQEQLGLKLESAKSPIELIVIDRVERPSGN
jgi:bla regulator protein blaR1